ncbi:TetR family transcriptional regulator [Bradyrhizobium manausense]
MAACPRNALSARLTMQRPILSPAQRRRETQRERIIAEAVRLFQENGGEPSGGFEATTIENIAERADISVRTFFRYFESKADVIYLDTARSLEDLRGAIVERLESDRPLRAVVSATVDVLKRFTANPVNKARLALALTSRNWIDRRALWTIQKRQLVTELLMPFCDDDAAGFERAYMTAIIGLSVTDSATATWVRFPKSNLLQLVQLALERAQPLIAQYELPAAGKPRVRRAAKG